MDRASSRRIFKAIEENYDEANERYIGTATDDTIAKDLRVPRAWVEQVREAHFGAAGSNEEIGALTAAVTAKIAEVEKVIDMALTAAGDAEKVKTDLIEMRKRLGRIEATLGSRGK